MVGKRAKRTFRVLGPKGSRAITVAVHARLNVDKWRKTRKPVHVTVEQLDAFINGLKKTRGVAKVREGWNE